MFSKTLLILLAAVYCFLSGATAVVYTTYPKLPKFLSNNPLPHGFPWGYANATNTNPETGVPRTGKTRFYNLEITRQAFAPDGFNRTGILINGQFPGPLIEANWGDTLYIKVTNKIKDEGTSLHWHGQHMRLSPEADGVPSVTQCPIAPGKTLTYVFRAENYGTSWYHSHFSGQYMDGAFGPLIIYGPRTQKYDEDLGPVLLSDHFHVDYYESIRRALSIPPIFDLAQNNLINGKMDVRCIPGSTSGPCDINKLSRFGFVPGKTYLLRLVNTGSAATQKFSIDGHDLTVVANDYVAIKPYTTKVVTLGIGQRADVLVKAKGKPTDLVWMRSELDRECFVFAVDQPTSLAVVSYPGAARDKAPATSGAAWSSNGCRNDPLTLTTPEFAITPPAQPAATQEIHMDAYVNATGHLVWHMNNQTFRGNYNHPIFLLAKLGNTSYPHDPQWNVFNFGKSESIRIVLYNHFPLTHPMHLHGHNFWVLAEGQGVWDGAVTNAANPQRRDVQLLAPGQPNNPAFIVLEFAADNPGVWPLHCHIVADVGLGLYVNIMERPDLIRKREVPFSAAETCRDWWKFTSTEFVNQIDSGL